jgi:hypothetical protein
MKLSGDVSTAADVSGTRLLSSAASARMRSRATRWRFCSAWSSSPSPVGHVAQRLLRDGNAGARRAGQRAVVLARRFKFVELALLLHLQLLVERIEARLCFELCVCRGCEKPSERDD